MLTRIVIFVVAALSVADGHAATYRGRVEYAGTGKPAAHIIVEARSWSGPNLLFWVPRVMYEPVGSASSRLMVHSLSSYRMESHGSDSRLAAFSMLVATHIGTQRLLRERTHLTSSDYPRAFSRGIPNDLTKRCSEPLAALRQS